MTHRTTETGIDQVLHVAVLHPFPIVAEALAAQVLALAPGARRADPARADLVIAALDSLDDVDVKPDASVVALVDYADRRPLQDARNRGARAALTLDMGTAQLSAALSAIVGGRAWWPVVTAGADVAELPPMRRLDTLSGQQFRVLDLMSQGRLNKQIAYDLGISEGTVKSHVSSILRKLGVERRTQAIAAFITTGDVARGGGAHLSRAAHAAR